MGTTWESGLLGAELWDLAIGYRDLGCGFRGVVVDAGADARVCLHVWDVLWIQKILLGDWGTESRDRVGDVGHSPGQSPGVLEEAIGALLAPILL